MAGQRSTRLSMLALIQEGILEPGEKLLTFDYMREESDSLTLAVVFQGKLSSKVEVVKYGKRCEADLLPDGMIQWNGSKYSSPYAWASQCKNQVNPDHKSGIGWGHIRYKGIKLSQYKTVYMKKYQLGCSDVSDSLSPMEESSELKLPVKRGRKRNVYVSQDDNSSQAAGLKSLGIKESSPNPVASTAQSNSTSTTSGQDNKVIISSFQSSQAQQSIMTTTTTAPNQLIECKAFSHHEDQPFTVSVTSNTLMIMDFHSHLSTGEVVGYLGGSYDKDKKALEVKEAFPCKCDVTSGVEAKQVEAKISATLHQKGLTLVGWYHSHPISEAKPSQNDIISQKSYQEAMKTDSGDEPCIGIIISPNHGGLQSDAVSTFEVFYVVFVELDGLKASAMKFQYSIKWESYLTQEVVDEMNALTSYYKSQSNCPKFLSMWKGETYFINKFKKSLAKVQPKFPGENSDQTFMTYIDQLLVSEYKH